MTVPGWSNTPEQKLRDAEDFEMLALRAKTRPHEWTAGITRDDFVAECLARAKRLRAEAEGMK